MAAEQLSQVHVVWSDYILMAHKIDINALIKLYVKLCNVIVSNNLYSLISTLILYMYL